MSRSTATAILIRPDSVDEIAVDPAKPGLSINADFPEFAILRKGTRSIQLIYDEDGITKELAPNFMLDADVTLGDALLMVYDGNSRVQPTAEELSEIRGLASKLTERRPSASDIATWKRRAGVTILDEEGRVIADVPVFDDLGKIQPLDES